MALYELPANAHFDVFRKRMNEGHRSLQTINISNCIVVPPSLLIPPLSRMKNLHTLLCVSCPIRVSALLDLLFGPLYKVTHLEFSLVETWNNAMDENFCLRLLARRRRGKFTTLRKVYAEVGDEVNAGLLMSFLYYCPILEDLHVHLLRNVPFDLDPVNKLEKFTFTCEAPSTTQSLEQPLEQPLKLKNCVDIHGNVARVRRPETMNYARLLDLADSSNRSLLLQPVVLVALDSWDLGKCFLDAGRGRKWGDIRSLCILLFAGNRSETVYPVVRTVHYAGMRDFFSRLANVVELNLSSFHFGDGIDFTTLLETPALQRLRALSLPPCSLPTSGAVRRLAHGLSDIEDLDIRLNLDGRHKKCYSCNTVLNIAPEDAGAFRIGSGRLTLSNVPKLASLDFLRRFQMSSLRFVDSSEKPRFDYKALSNVVRCNKNLRSLVVRLANINFTERSFKNSMCPGKALERLCLLSNIKVTSEIAEKRVDMMARQLPRIFYLHFHYVDTETGMDATVTWMRRHEDDVVDTSQQGRVMHDAPCIMCSTQTFIALVKPHFREL